jgi:leader peptidase (prepilin peptidase)/N-methyltransferase
MSTVTGAILAGLFGAIFGSFLNVVAYRLPRGESLVKPRSRCPGCGAPIKPQHNVPVLSWLALRGRCANCGEPISGRYPLVELATALLCAACVVRFGADRDVWLPLAFVLLLVPITLIDLDFRIIPNVLVAIGTVIAIVLVLATRSDDLVEHLLAAAIGGGFLLLAALAYPPGMGMGDVKLVFMMGLFLGRALAPGMLIGFLSASMVGFAVMARKGVKEGRKTAIPFGPFLAFGGLVGLFAGDEIVDWYLDTFA